MSHHIYIQVQKKYVNGQWRDYNDYAFEPQYYLYQLHQKRKSLEILEGLFLELQELIDVVS